MSETIDESKKNPNLEEAREHMKAARQAMHKTMEAWLPEGYLENRRKARKEMLQAMRSLLNAAIERMEKTND